MSNKEVQELKENVKTLETMFSSLVNILEKKKIISDKELDEQIRKRLTEEMNKSKTPQPSKKRLITKQVLILMIVTLLIVPVAISSNSSLPSKPSITGLVTGVTDETSNAASGTNISDTDIVVWQGQYFKGKEFQTGTYQFNFTIYDAPIGGGGMLFQHNYFNNG